MAKIDNFDNDEAFFKIVNDHKIEIDVDKNSKINLNNLYPFIERGVENSIRNVEDEIRYERQVERDKRNNKKIVGVLLAAIIILGSVLYIAGKKITDHMKINMVSDLGIHEMQSKMLVGDLAYLNVTSVDDNNKKYEFVVKDNSVEDYGRISVDGFEDIYFMKNTLTNKDEFNDFIKSQTYVDKDTGEVLYYENFMHFLYVNDFKTEVNFNRAIEKLLLDRYENEDVRIDRNNVDLNYVPTSRGGK